MIALSVMLMTAVLNIATSLQRTIYNEAVAVSGDAHVRFSHITSGQAGLLAGHEAVKWSDLHLSLRTWGDIPGEDNSGIGILYSSYLGKLAGFTLQSGQVPEEANEVVIAPHTAKALGIPDEPGTAFTLTLYEEDGTNWDHEFVISGILQEQKYFEAIDSHNMFISEAFALAHGSFAERYRQDTEQEQSLDRRDIYLHLKKGYQAEAAAQMLASLAGIEEEDIQVNTQYLNATLQDPVAIVMVAVVLIILMLTGALVIYNAFNIIIVKRTHQFGLLALVGASKRQIRICVYLEAVLSAVLAIPAGMLLGTGFSLLGSPAVTRMVQAVDFAFHVEPWTYGLTALLSFLMVFTGILSPARKAAGVTPVEAVRLSGAQAAARKSKPVNHITLPVLARLNMQRSRGRTISTILAFSVSGVLFLSIATVGFSMLGSLDRLTSHMVAGDIQVLTGTEKGNMYISPVKNQLTPEMLDRLGSIDGVERMDAFTTQGYCSGFTQEGDESYPSDFGTVIGMNDEVLLDLLSRVYEGGPSLEELKISGNVLAISNDHKSVAQYNYHVGQTITVYLEEQQGWATENTASFHVVGLIASDDFPPYVQSFWSLPALIMPSEAYLQYGLDTTYETASLMIDEEKHDSIVMALQGISSQNDEIYYKSNIELIRELRRQLMGILALILMAVFIISLIGILNLISSVFISIEQRQREFGVLSALGLSKSGLRRLLGYESNHIAVISMLLSVVLGLGAGCGLYRLLIGLGADYLRFTFPLVPLIALCLVYGIVPYIVTRAAVDRLFQSTTTELLRQDS